MPTIFSALSLKINALLGVMPNFKVNYAKDPSTKMQLDRLESYFKKQESESQISIVELKRLLVLLAENVQSVCIRYRIVGKMWEPNFLRVIQVTDKELFFKDEIKDRMISLADIRMIIQFELDGSVHTFQPNYHYNVAVHADGK